MTLKRNSIGSLCLLTKKFLNYVFTKSPPKLSFYCKKMIYLDPTIESFFKLLMEYVVKLSKTFKKIVVFEVKK